MSVQEELAEMRAKAQRAADKLAWRQYACAALSSMSVISQGNVEGSTIVSAIPEEAASAADRMLELERGRFGGEP